MENIYKVNKNKIKTILSKNLKTDASGRVVISKDDEWLKETEWDYPIIYWSEAGLRLKSTARISKAMYLSSDNFIFKIGDLHKEDLSEVDKMFIEYINLQ